MLGKHDDADEICIWVRFPHLPYQMKEHCDAIQSHMRKKGVRKWNRGKFSILFHDVPEDKNCS